MIGSELEDRLHGKPLKLWALSYDDFQAALALENRRRVVIQTDDAGEALVRLRRPLFSSLIGLLTGFKKRHAAATR